MKLRFILSAILVFVTFGAFATTQTSDIDISNPASFVQLLTPIIVLGVTWVVRKISGFIPSWATILVVPVLSAAVSWATTLLDNPNLSWLLQFLYGLLAVFIHQFYKQITTKD